MINLKEFQKDIYNLKKERGFNTKDIYLEFCLLQGELSEAFLAHKKKLPDLGEELADVAIYLLGLSEILKIDLEKEIKNKHQKNKKRVYKRINGVLTKVKND